MSQAVDAVYTWVNGSDPEFLNSLHETDLGLKTSPLDVAPERFEGSIQTFFRFLLTLEIF